MRGQTREGRRSTRPLLWASAALLIALAAYSAVTAVRAASAYGQMLEAKSQMLSASAVLEREGLDAGPDSLARAEDQVRDARGRFRSARDLLEDEPLLRLVGWLPWVGSQVGAARGLAAIGYESSEIGLAGVDALRSLAEVRANEGRPVGADATAYLETTEPMLREVEERLATIRERRDDIDTSLALPPISAFVPELDAELARLEEIARRYHDGHAVATHVLGIDRSQTHLVLGLDNTELLPAGGLIGSYGVITFRQGQLQRRRFGEVSDLFEAWQRRSGGEYVQPPGPLQRYLLRDWTWNLSVSGWSPDFPTAARRALDFYGRSGAEPVDGIIAVDFTGLEGLLAVLGPAEIDGYGVTVDSDNVTEEILTRIGKPLRPGEGKHAFARTVAAEVIEEALAADGEQWVPLLETLDRLAREKHLFLYANDPEVQDAITRLGWGGAVRDGPGDYLMAAETSVHSSKLNLVVEREIDLRVRLDEAGAAHHRLLVHYRNDLEEWAAGRDPDLVHHMLEGLYGGYLRLLAPPQAELREVMLDGRSVGAEEVLREADKVSFGRYVPLPSGSHANVTFLYGVPGVADVSEATHEYRLLLQKQPGTPPTPLRLTVTLPPGARVESVSLDGRDLPDAPLQIATSLSTDRELVVRYELGGE